MKFIKFGGDEGESLYVNLSHITSIIMDVSSWNADVPYGWRIRMSRLSGGIEENFKEEKEAQARFAHILAAMNAIS